MEEIWKDIPNFPNYQVSNFGNVRSLDRKIRQWNRFDNIERIYNGKILKPKLTKRGYLSVGLTVDKKTKYCLIHRLVANCFLEEFDEKLTVDHIDCNKLNNNANNLQMVTIKRNIQLSYENNLHKLRKVAKCDKENNLLEIYDSVADASRKNNCSSQLIKNCCDNKKHCLTGKGYVWKYYKEED